MKHIITSIIIALCLSSCNGINVLGHKVELVNNRAPDGTYLPDNQVVNSDGEHPDSSAKLYHYPSGNLGVSVYYGGVLTGARPAIK
jgi:hypothetical protein